MLSIMSACAASQVSSHSKDLRETRANAVQQRVHDRPGDRAFQLVEAGGRGRFDALFLLQCRAQLRHELLAPLQDAGPLFLLQRGERLVVHRLVVDQRHQEEAGGIALEQEAGGARLRRKLRKHGVAMPLDRPQDLVAAADEVVGLEGARDALLCLRDHVLHRHAELGALAGREAQRVGPVRLVEVVNVAPVVRRQSAAGVVLDVLADRRRAAGAGLTGNDDVEALALDGQAELQRLDRAVLADQADKRLDLLSSREAVD